MVPPKRDILREVDDVLYLAFMRDIFKSVHRIRTCFVAMNVIILCVFVPTLFSPDNQIQYWILVACISAYLCMVICCRSPGKVVERYRSQFREHGISVEYVEYELGQG